MKVLQRGTLVIAAVVALAACQFSLVVTPDDPLAGDLVHVTNEGADQTCEPNVPYLFFVISNVMEDDPESAPTFEGTTDENGLFAFDVEAPDLPGQHILYGGCGEGIDDPPSDEGSASQEEPPADEPIFYADTINVAQGPLTLELAQTEVHAGDSITATFSMCGAQNLMGFFDDTFGDEPFGDTTVDELVNDFPDLDVLVDGKKVKTVHASERNPDGTVDVPITFDTEGEHTVSGVCRFQTLTIDEETLADEVGDDFPGGEESSFRTSAVDYPQAEDIFIFDEDTVETAADAEGTTVNVLAAEVEAPPEPAPEPTPTPTPQPVQPTFTG